MTFKEAADFFREDLQNGKCNDSCPDCNARELAIRACDKQTATFVDCPGGWQGVRYTRFLCPSCKSRLRQSEKYCHSCGQHVKYPVQKVVDNRIVLDWNEGESK